MSYENSFSSMLIKELKNSELLPSFDEFTAVSRSVISQGRKELTHCRTEIGPVIWWKGFFELRQWYFGYVGVAGWGYYLSSYFNAPLKLSPSENEMVGHLGSLSSLIVTLYDSFLDKKVPQHLPIPHSWLTNILLNDQTLQMANEKFESAAIELLSRLIRLFVSGIYELPYAERRPEILSLLRKCIMKMYEAENKTVVCHPQQISASTLTRKSAFPFLVMGLIGWLVSSDFDQGLFDWHLRWSYKMGYFYSLIDDAADVEHDRLKGYPNLFIDHVDSFGQFDWTQKIARKGMQLHGEWKQRVPKHRLPFNVSMVLASSLAAWLQ